LKLTIFPSRVLCIQATRQDGLISKPNSYAIYKQLQKAKLNTVQMTIWTLLHDQLWYPYCTEQVPVLMPADSPA
jgi:hypothetical protein